MQTCAEGASKRWMATSPQFAANPIGVQFDPNKLVDGLAAGLTHDEIHRLAYNCEFAPARVNRPELALCAHASGLHWYRRSMSDSAIFRQLSHE
jgi:hypothetical protein